jgi:hypothetical protein
MLNQIYSPSVLKEINEKTMIGCVHATTTVFQRFRKNVLSGRKGCEENKTVPNKIEKEIK